MTGDMVSRRYCAATWRRDVVELHGLRVAVRHRVCAPRLAEKRCAGSISFMTLSRDVHSPDLIAESELRTSP